MLFAGVPDHKFYLRRTGMEQHAFADGKKDDR